MLLMLFTSTIGRLSFIIPNGHNKVIIILAMQDMLTIVVLTALFCVCISCIYQVHFENKKKII